MSGATATRNDRVYGPAQVVQSNQPEFSGTSAPGSIIRLLVSPATKPWDSSLAGRTTANAGGQWSLTTRHPLRNGQYRTVVSAFLATDDPARAGRHPHPTIGPTGRRRVRPILEATENDLCNPDTPGRCRWRIWLNQDLRRGFDCDGITLRLTMDDAFLHHQFNLAQGFDVAGRVAADGDQVSQKTWLDCTNPIVEAQGFGSDGCRRKKRLGWPHTIVDE